MKKRLISTTIILTMCLSFIFTDANAQTKTAEFEPYWKIGINYGGSLYQGDIRKDGLFWFGRVNEIRPSGDINFSRQFSYVVGLQAQFVGGKLNGVKNNMNRYFESDYWEFNLQCKINISNLIGKKRSNRMINVIIYAGPGIMSYNSTLYCSEKKTELNSGTGFLPVLPIGAEIEIQITERWNLTLGSASRLMFSDKLDTVINNKNDVYNYTHVGISFEF